MKLLYQSHSPYARKVLVAAYELGLHERLEVIHHETSPTRRNDAVFALNPLGKVPVLIRDEGQVLFDSNVICEYFDGLCGGHKLIPAEPEARLLTLRAQSLAQGIADAGICARWEADRRPAHLRWPTMHAGQIAKIAAACDLLEQELPTDDPRAASSPAAANLGDIALATALSWIEFRGVYPFAADRHRLAAWYAAFRSRPSMLATALAGETRD